MLESLFLHVNERNAVRICGKVYFWTRESGKPLKLNTALVGGNLHPTFLARLAAKN